MIEFRCPKCHKLLFKAVVNGIYVIEIRCKCCKKLCMFESVNAYKASDKFRGKLALFGE